VNDFVSAKTQLVDLSLMEINTFIPLLNINVIFSKAIHYKNNPQSDINYGDANHQI
jgi:hypothetical protein